MEFTGMIVMKNFSFKRSVFPINFLVTLPQEKSLEIPGGGGEGRVFKSPEFHKGIGI